jgi:hypothetical protein
LAIEYNGVQHYTTTSVLGDFKTQQMRDASKRENSKLHGITLITIPFWWNKEIESLATTIQAHRPDLITNFSGGKLIEENIPDNVLARSDMKGTYCILFSHCNVSGVSKCKY